MGEIELRNAVKAISNDPTGFVETIMGLQTRQEVRQWIQDEYDLSEDESAILAKQQIGMMHQLGEVVERHIKMNKADKGQQF